MRLLFAGFLACQTFNLLADVELDRIVAVVENDIIMQSELETKLRTVVGQMQEQGMQLPPSNVLETQVLERIILMKIQLQKAEETGIRVDDETLNRTISNIAAGNNVSLSQFKEILEKDGFSYEKFRENMREEIIISRLRQRQVDNRISITSKEIDNALANLEFQGNTETEYLLQHILISLPETPTPEEEEQALLVATKVLEDLNTGLDFATMASTVSDGQRALEGGDLGWRKKNEIPTIFSAQIATMEKGDISDLIKSSSGFHIVKLADVRSSEKHMITQTDARHILIKVDALTTADDAWVKSIAGGNGDASGIFAIRPGEFGLKGEVLAQMSLDSDNDKILDTLVAANVTFAKTTAKKVYATHVVKGKKLGIYFEGAVPYGEDRDGDGVIDKAPGRGRGRSGEGRPAGNRPAGRQVRADARGRG